MAHGSYPDLWWPASPTTLIHRALPGYPPYWEAVPRGHVSRACLVGPRKRGGGRAGLTPLCESPRPAPLPVPSDGVLVPHTPRGNRTHPTGFGDPSGHQPSLSAHFSYGRARIRTGKDGGSKPPESAHSSTRHQVVEVDRFSPELAFAAAASEPFLRHPLQRVEDPPP